MKPIFITLLGLCFAAATQLKAQSFLDKLDRTLNKVDRAANTADRAAGTGGKMMGLLGKRKTSGENQTLINIKGIDIASLKTLNQNIQTTKNVSSTKRKFSADASSIVVSHSGSTDELLQSLQQVSTSLSDKNISQLEEGSITVDIKK